MKKFIFKLFKIKSKRVKAAERLLKLIEISSKYGCDYKFDFGLCYLTDHIYSPIQHRLYTKAISTLYKDFPNKSFWFPTGDFKSRIEYLEKVKNENN